MNDITVTAIKDQIEALSSEGRALIIADNNSYLYAGEFLRRIKTAQKQLDDTRKGMTRPLDESKKKIMDLFRPVEGKIAEVEASVKRSLLTYQEEQDRRLQAELEERRKKDEAEMAEKLKDAEFFGNDTIDIEPSSASEMPVNMPVKAEGISTRTVWEFEIVDESKLPREMLSADLKKIRAAVEFGMRDVAGLRIYPMKQMSARR